MKKLLTCPSDETIWGVIVAEVTFKVSILTENYFSIFNNV